MDKLVEEIHKILDQFLREELGNKVTQFTVMGLRTVLYNTIKKHFGEKTEG